MEEDDRRPVLAAREVAAHLAQAGRDEGGHYTAIVAFNVWEQILCKYSIVFVSSVYLISLFRHGTGTSLLAGLTLDTMVFVLF